LGTHPRISRGLPDSPWRGARVFEARVRSEGQCVLDRSAGLVIAASCPAPPVAAMACILGRNRHVLNQTASADLRRAAGKEGVNVRLPADNSKVHSGCLDDFAIDSQRSWPESVSIVMCGPEAGADPPRSLSLSPPPRPGSRLAEVARALRLCKVFAGCGRNGTSSRPVLSGGMTRPNPWARTELMACHIRHCELRRRVQFNQFANHWVRLALKGWPDCQLAATRQQRARVPAVFLSSRVAPATIPVQTQSVQQNHRLGIASGPQRITWCSPPGFSSGRLREDRRNAKASRQRHWAVAPAGDPQRDPGAVSPRPPPQTPNPVPGSNPSGGYYHRAARNHSRVGRDSARRWLWHSVWWIGHRSCHHHISRNLQAPGGQDWIAHLGEFLIGFPARPGWKNQIGPTRLCARPLHTARSAVLH